MRKGTLNLGCAIGIAIFFGVSSASPSQDRAGQEATAQEALVRQLHPEPVKGDPPKGIRLLAGYQHKGATDFEGNEVGEISKSDGVAINYEMGHSEGMAVDPDRKADYVWYREQKINGRITRYALTKSGVLTISIALSKQPNTSHAANFYGAIKKPEDIADMLLMIMPFAYENCGSSTPQN